jgi:hypothetical protein
MDDSEDSTVVSPLFVLPEDSQTGDTYLSTQYTLRCCNRDYRRVLGTEITGNENAELDGNKVPGKVAPLMTFDNSFGQWVPREEKLHNGKHVVIKAHTKVFPPRHCQDLDDMISVVKLYIRRTKNLKRLWDLYGTVTIDIDQAFKKDYPKEFQTVIKLQESSPYNPHSAYSAQAYIESSLARGRDKPLYTLPRQSTVVTGMLGGLHNNTSLQMGFEEEGMADPEKRAYDIKYLGFICAGHTSHSSDAGKSRRVTSYTRVRVLWESILDCVKLRCSTQEDRRDWIVYCMGITCYVSETEAWCIAHNLTKSSIEYFKDQFSFDGARRLMCPAGYMVYEDAKVLYISISSGVIMRSTTADSMIDSSMLNHQKPNSIVEHPPLPTHGSHSMKFLYSPFFMLAPFAQHDRPPRGLFASGQTTQGIFWPWSPATARVSPLHASRPIVATQFARDIEKDAGLNDGAIWDIFPGEDLVICYMNMPLNYDDSIIVSSKFADMGGFSTISLCTYRISESENIPEEGEKLCNKKYKWWKVECTDTCICKRKDGSRMVSTSGRVPSGIVHQVIRTEDGHISIKVRSFSQLLSGDKISTMHGQKGVVRIVDVHKLPVIVLKDGSTMIADAYMAVGSIVSRQTNGQIYESACGWKGAKEGQLQTVGDVTSTDSEECDHILFADTGKVIMRQMPSGKVEPIKASIGMTRFLNQTQMTREKHQLTHRPEGKFSTGTRSGRADGGGVAASEMDFHVMYSSGLYGCAQELFDRGNACLVPVCRNCKAIMSVHDCGKDSDVAMTIMSFDNVVFDQISACVNGSCNRYEIEHM